MAINIQSISDYKKSMIERDAQKEEANGVFGTSRTAHRFKVKDDFECPIYYEIDGWVLRYFNIRPNNTADYIIYRQADVDAAKHWENIPVIEFRCSNYFMDFLGFDRLTILQNVPKIVHVLINRLIKEHKITNQLPVPVRYQKLYIAVLDEVPDFTT